MAFTLTLSTNNAAFGEELHESAPEIARILREVADMLEGGRLSGHVPLHDVNGNRVGFYQLSSL